MFKRLLFLLVLFGVMGVTHAQGAAHPRLWVRADDLPRLRGWAVETNPVWMQLAALTTEAAAAMDAGQLDSGDTGSTAWEEYPHETYAMLFAFMSLVHPDQAARDDYANRARTLLMEMMNQAAQGAADAPFRYPAFSTSDRSRWYGLGFALTVDWIYSYLSAEDKATIRTVFLRWCEENRTATTTNHNHPEPVGVTNDPVLLSDRSLVRWSGNNYYAAHMRNMGLMALALDPADDPDGTLRAYLDNATGAWLYIIDHLTRTDVAGGMSAEGFEYGPQTFGYVAQFLLALYTAGEADPALRGQQVTFEGNPFWDDSVMAYLHSLSPAPAQHEWMGSIYQPAWYGSGQNYHMPDPIESFGALGVYDMLTSNTDRLNALRWIETYTAPGGADGMSERMDAGALHVPILYFLLFDPAAPAPTDPRVSLDTTYYAPGMRRLSARTDWTENATWFVYANSWNDVDHQSGNANSIEFYRNGEWLTKVRVGYDLDYQTSENVNTLAIQNTPPEHTDYRYMIYERGSQWLYSASGDPAEPVITYGDGYITAYGEATNAYNSDYEGSTDVVLATRSVVWLMPDAIVIYDHAITQSPGFKRFWLNLPTAATTADNLTTMITPSGQQFWIYTLLPADAALSVIELGEEPSGTPANGDLVRYRFGAEATGNPTEAYFLHVLVGGDGGATPPAVELLSADPATPSVRVGDQVVAFAGENITVSPAN